MGDEGRETGAGSAPTRPGASTRTSNRLIAQDLSGDFTDRPASIRIAPDSSSIADYLHDESKMSAQSVASIAVPDSLDELRRVMRWHADRGHVLSISGSRTGLTGGGVPAEGTHLVSLASMRGVLRVDDEGEQPTATVLGGTSLSELTGYLGERHPGLVFPVDPTETGASLGGMVATNASGGRSFRFGATRDWVEALTVELASGRTLRLRRRPKAIEVAPSAPPVTQEITLEDGTGERRLTLGAIPKPPTKNAVGYAFGTDADVVDLFVGAEGTLGVISEVTVRLVRQRESCLGLLQFFPGAREAFAFVSALRSGDGLRATAIEFLDARSHALALESGTPATERVLRLAPDESCSVFTEIAYATEEELATSAERLEQLVAASGGDSRASLGGATEDELRDVRAFRHAVPERINAIIAQRRALVPGLHKVATDMAVVDADLPWVYELYRARLTSEKLDFAIFGHVGNNHFHVNILPRDARELARAKEIYVDFARAVVARGGCVAAEHGMGRLKKRFLSVQYADSVLATMRSIKRWADPDWRLNPGVLIDP